MDTIIQGMHGIYLCFLCESVACGIVLSYLDQIACSGLFVFNDSLVFLHV